MTTPVEVVVIDDHELVATALRLALVEAGFRVSCPAVADVLSQLTVDAPVRRSGVVLLDLGLGELDGAELVTPLTRRGWSVLVVTGDQRTDRISAAVARGACGWVSKSAPFEELVEAVRAVAQGRAVLSDAERAALVQQYWNRDAALLTRLSAREMAVLTSLARGRRAKEIAADSVVSITTVRAQIRSILTKLEVSSQLAAVALLHRE